ncbi:MAG: hypothetical protein ACOCXM_11820, partial [Myxococcota bacterium]
SENGNQPSDASTDDAMVWTECSTRLQAGDLCTGDLGPCTGDCCDGTAETYTCENGVVRVEGRCDPCSSPDASTDGATDAANDAMVWTECSTRIQAGDRCMGDLGPCHGDCTDGGFETYTCEEGRVQLEGGC